MTATCPYCGKVFPSEDHAFYGHKGSCSKNPKNVKAPEPAPAVTGQAGATGPTVSGGSTPPPSRAPQKQAAQVQQFFFTKQPNMDLGPLDLGTGTQGGTSQQPTPGQPAAPGQPVPAPTQPLAGQQLKAIIEQLQGRWNSWLTSAPGTPSIEAAKWGDLDTKLLVDALDGLDAKYHMGDITKWVPELTLATFVGVMLGHIIAGFRYKGVFKGGLRVGPGGKPTETGFTKQEEKAMAEDWEAELKRRAEGGGPQEPGPKPPEKP